MLKLRPIGLFVMGAIAGGITIGGLHMMEKQAVAAGPGKE